MSYRPATTQITCPNCQTQFTVRVRNIVDVGQEPQLKELLLSGQLNVVTCPQCGMTSQLGVPLVYHDPEKELLVAYVPGELNMQMEEEEKLIGRLSNQVMEATPAEARKGYFLNPKRAMSMQGLIETILEADGISREDIRRQTEALQLMLQMADAAENEEALKALYEEHEETIDYQFLMMLASTIEASKERQDEQLVRKLETLRDRLIDLADLSPADIPRVARDASYDDLLQMLRDAEESELTAIVATNRPALDYGFFMHVTQQIENTADPDEAEELEALRATLVEITDSMDARAKEAVERAGEQLRAIMTATDVEAAVKERIDELDEAFLMVLSANIDAAQKEGREDIVERLQHIYRVVVEEAEKNLRPEFQAINELLRTESEAEREKLLRDALTTYNPAGFIELIDTLIADVSGQGVSPNLLERLNAIADQARAVHDSMQVTEA